MLGKWFGKKSQCQEPEGDKPDDPEDVNRANFIQQKAQVGEMFANRLSDPDEDQTSQRQRYENIRDELLNVLDQIEDEFYRGFATHQLAIMCATANDDAVCKALLTGVRDSFFRKKILEDCPRLEAING